MSSGLGAGHPVVLQELLESFVRSGTVAGAVALVERDGRREVAVAGVADLATGRLLTRDTPFRYASITKPLVAAATMTFVDDGALRLDDPIERWLPELRGVRVLRTPDADLDDTVALQRPQSVEDLLTSRCGWGFPSSFEGEWVQSLFPLQPGLEISLPPAPQEWLTALAALPLRHQPGEGWLYNTSFDLLGILLARVGGADLGEVLRTRLFGPLGMRDTAFSAAPDRLPAAYRLGADGLDLFDASDGRWSSPPRFLSGAGGLVGTLDDWSRFAHELLAPRLLSPDAVRAMTTDHLIDAQRLEGEVFLEGEGWGFGGSVHPVTGRYGWVGGSGTSAHVVPARGTTGILLTQTAMDSPVPPTFLREFWDYAF
ncbi:beta-lactamase family protein [Kineococcus sp. NBC_00420]|uniref:serine hydrolase domain-containing protein n=1 Tax=Kineococcus sp. NBC_00420 TaxID=2903564 RepID=UPI002E200F0A